MRRPEEQPARRKGGSFQSFSILFNPWAQALHGVTGSSSKGEPPGSRSRLGYKKKRERVAGEMATMGSMGTMRCDATAATTRRLVEREAGHVKNMDLDKLDNCGEVPAKGNLLVTPQVTLGLISVITCTIAVWILGLNFFDMARPSCALLSWARCACSGSGPGRTSLAGCGGPS